MPDYRLTFPTRTNANRPIKLFDNRCVVSGYAKPGHGREDLLVYLRRPGGGIEGFHPARVRLANGKLFWTAVINLRNNPNTTTGGYSLVLTARGAAGGDYAQADDPLDGLRFVRIPRTVAPAPQARDRVSIISPEPMTEHDKYAFSVYGRVTEPMEEVPVANCKLKDPKGGTQTADGAAAVGDGPLWWCTFDEVAYTPKVEYTFETMSNLMNPASVDRLTFTG